MRLLKIIFLGALWMASGLSWAEQAVDPKALAKVQFMLRQMSGERDALQAENIRLKEELNVLKAKKSSTDGALAKFKGQSQELKDKLDQTLSEKQKADATVTERSLQLEQCSSKNARLYDLNVDLLKLYTDKGLADVLSRREPFTGFKKIEMENLVQNLQDKLDEQRYIDGPAAQPSNEAGQSAR